MEVRQGQVFLFYHILSDMEKKTIFTFYLELRHEQAIQGVWSDIEGLRVAPLAIPCPVFNCHVSVCG